MTDSLAARLLAEIERREGELGRDSTVNAQYHHPEDIRDRRAYLAALRRIAQMHTQTDGMGYLPDDGGQYGKMSSVCACCGTPDEYGCPWPCLEVRIVATALGVSVDG